MTERDRQGLGDDRQVVAVVRVMVSDGGRLLYGEAIDAATERARRFATWHGLVDALHALIGEAVGRGSNSDLVAAPDRPGPPNTTSTGDEPSGERRNRP